MHDYRIITRCIAALFVVHALILPSSAADFAWPSSPYLYSVVDQDLKVVLNELGRNVGLRMQISDKVAGRVRGNIPHETSKEFFVNICKSYGLEWYFDGFIMHVSSADENGTGIIDTRGFRVSDVKDMLRSSRIYDERFPVEGATGARNLTVSGPPSYILLVERLVSSLTQARAKTVLYRADQMTVVKFGGTDDETARLAGRAPAEAAAKDGAR